MIADKLTEEMTFRAEWKGGKRDSCKAATDPQNFGIKDFMWLFL